MSLYNKNNIVLPELGSTSSVRSHHGAGEVTHFGTDARCRVPQFDSHNKEGFGR